MKLARRPKRGANPYRAPQSTARDRAERSEETIDGFMIASVIVGGLGLLATALFIILLASYLFSLNLGRVASTQLSIDLVFVGLFGFLWIVSGVFYFRLVRVRARVFLVAGVFVFTAMQFRMYM